jgi:hypothetical protein
VDGLLDSTLGEVTGLVSGVTGINTGTLLGL